MILCLSSIRIKTTRLLLIRALICQQQTKTSTNENVTNSLKERIKCEVVKYVELKEFISNIPIEIIERDDPNEVNYSAELMQCKDNDLIINQLNREVENLHAELKSKDTIIEMLRNTKMIIRICYGK